MGGRMSDREGPAEATTNEMVLVWGTFLVPLLLSLPVFWLLSGSGIPFSPVIPSLFVGVYGAAVAGVSLWTGFFVFRKPFAFGSTARTTHRSEEPVWYVIHLLGFGGLGLFGLVNAVIGG